MPSSSRRKKIFGGPSPRSTKSTTERLPEPSVERDKRRSFAFMKYSPSSKRSNTSMKRTREHARQLVMQLSHDPAEQEYYEPPPSAPLHKEFQIELQKTPTLDVIENFRRSERLGKKNLKSPGGVLDKKPPRASSEIGLNSRGRTAKTIPSNLNMPFRRKYVDNDPCGESLQKSFHGLKRSNDSSFGSSVSVGTAGSNNTKISSINYRSNGSITGGSTAASTANTTTSSYYNNNSRTPGIDHGLSFDAFGLDEEVLDQEVTEAMRDMEVSWDEEFPLQSFDSPNGSRSAKLQQQDEDGFQDGFRLAGAGSLPLQVRASPAGSDRSSLTASTDRAAQEGNFNFFKEKAGFHRSKSSSNETKKSQERMMPTSDEWAKFGGEAFGDVLTPDHVNTQQQVRPDLTSDNKISQEVQHDEGFEESIFSDFSDGFDDAFANFQTMSDFPSNNPTTIDPFSSDSDVLSNNAVNSESESAAHSGISDKQDLPTEVLGRKVKKKKKKKKKKKNHSIEGKKADFSPVKSHNSSNWGSFTPGKHDSSSWGEDIIPDEFSGNEEQERASTATNIPKKSLLLETSYELDKHVSKQLSRESKNNVDSWQDKTLESHGEFVTSKKIVTREIPLQQKREEECAQQRISFENMKSRSKAPNVLTIKSTPQSDIFDLQSAHSSELPNVEGWLRTRSRQKMDKELKDSQIITALKVSNDTDKFEEGNNTFFQSSFEPQFFSQEKTSFRVPPVSKPESKKIEGVNKEIALSLNDESKSKSVSFAVESFGTDCFQENISSEQRNEWDRFEHSTEGLDFGVSFQEVFDVQFQEPTQNMSDYRDDTPSIMETKTGISGFTLSPMKPHGSQPEHSTLDNEVFFNELLQQKSQSQKIEKNQQFYPNAVRNTGVLQKEVESHDHSASKILTYREKREQELKELQDKEAREVAEERGSPLPKKDVAALIRKRVAANKRTPRKNLEIKSNVENFGGMKYRLKKVSIESKITQFKARDEKIEKKEPEFISSTLNKSSHRPPKGFENIEASAQKSFSTSQNNTSKSNMPSLMREKVNTSFTETAAINSPMDDKGSIIDSGEITDSISTAIPNKSKKLLVSPKFTMQDKTSSAQTSLTETSKSVGDAKNKLSFMLAQRLEIGPALAEQSSNSEENKQVKSSSSDLANAKNKVGAMLAQRSAKSSSSDEALKNSEGASLAAQKANPGSSDSFDAKNKISTVLPKRFGNGPRLGEKEGRHAKHSTSDSTNNAKKNLSAMLATRLSVAPNAKALDNPKVAPLNNIKQNTTKKSTYEVTSQITSNVLSNSPEGERNTQQIPTTIPSESNFNGRPALKNDPKYDRYFRMLKVGMPMEVVKHAMERDGVDPSVMDGDHNKPAGFGTGVPLKEDPKYEKYFKMLKIGLPMGAVKNAVERDGLDPSVMDQDHNLPANCSSTSKKKVEKKPKDTHRRTRLHWDTVRKVRSNSLWAKIDQDQEIEDIKIDEDEFQALFQAELIPAATGKTRNGGKGKKGAAVRVIDSKRANNGGIILARLKITHDDMAEAVDQIDNGAISAEQMQNVIEYLPTVDERESLEKYMLSGGVDAAEKFDGLCECEKFMVAMMTVKHAKRKVRALLFRQQFESCLQSLVSDTNIVESACDELSNSVRLRKLLGIVLNVGNRLNTAGVSGKSKAGAFTLGSLLKLNHAKAFDKKTTFLHYIVLVVMRNNELLLRFTDDLPTVMKADRVYWDQVEQDLEEVENQLENVRQMSLHQARLVTRRRRRKRKKKKQKSDDDDNSLSDCSMSLEEEVELLRATEIGVFTLNAIKQVSALREKVEITQSKFKALLEYFGEDDNKDMQPHDVMNIIVTFSKNFEKAKEQVSENMKKKLRDERKSKRANSEPSLTAKKKVLNRKTSAPVHISNHQPNLCKVVKDINRKTTALKKKSLVIQKNMPDRRTISSTPNQMNRSRPQKQAENNIKKGTCTRLPPTTVNCKGKKVHTRETYQGQLQGEQKRKERSKHPSQHHNSDSSDMNSTVQNGYVGELKSTQHLPQRQQRVGRNNDIQTGKVTLPMSGKPLDLNASIQNVHAKDQNQAKSLCRNTHTQNRARNTADVNNNTGRTIDQNEQTLMQQIAMQQRRKMKSRIPTSSSRSSAAKSAGK